MSAAAEGMKIRFPEDYDARAEFETSAKEFLGDVVVQLEDKRCFRLFFMDSVRLQQELAAEANDGRPYLTEPNLVILSRVTTQAIRAAIHGMWQDGCFEQFKPSPSPEG